MSTEVQQQQAAPTAMEVQWQPIQCFERYDVSNFGQIRRHETGKILKPRLDKDGYPTVGLWCLKTHRKRIIRIHRAVLEAFHGKPEGLVPNHIDGVKSNNFLGNLEWVTISENTRHSYRMGLQVGKGAKGESAGKAKLTSKDVHAIRWLCAAGKKHRDIASMYGIGPTTVSYIRNRVTWNHI